jgi:hypothetical protein
VNFFINWITSGNEFMPFLLKMKHYFQLFLTRHLVRCTRLFYRSCSKFNGKNRRSGDFRIDCFICLIEQFFSYLAAVTITGDRAANFGLCSVLRAFEQGGIFIVPHQLRHRNSVYTVSFERLAPTSHSGIRTPDAMIIRSDCLIRSIV